MSSNIDRMVWVDTETFGLDPATCPIVEVGFMVTDIDLRVIDDFQMLVWDSPVYDKLLEGLSTSDDRVVYEMHEASRLWIDAQEDGRTPDDAREYMMSFLSGMGIDKGDPLCGSSVQFDRQMLAWWYPEAEALFSYRNIDISTVKELCMRYNRPVYDGLEGATQPLKHHRVLDDLADSINEFRFYRDNFLFI